jgi:hypothetical protein
VVVGIHLPEVVVAVVEERLHRMVHHHHLHLVVLLLTLMRDPLLIYVDRNILVCVIDRKRRGKMLNKYICIRMGEWNMRD